MCRYFRDRATQLDDWKSFDLMRDGFMVWRTLCLASIALCLGIFWNRGKLTEAVVYVGAGIGKQSDVGSIAVYFRLTVKYTVSRKPTQHRIHMTQAVRESRSAAKADSGRPGRKARGTPVAACSFVQCTGITNARKCLN